MNAVDPVRRWLQLIFCCLLFGESGLASRGLAATVAVNVGDNFFSPSTVAINVNDTVTWSWIGFSQHSSTSNTGLWDSGIHGRGFSFSRQFTSSGNFPYFCRVHPFQTGSVTVQAANSPPTITISSPATGTVINAPANVTIAATASDSDGGVTHVEFFQNAVSLGVKTASPYTAVAGNLAAGTYTFSAVATDKAGAKATNSVIVIVNALPAVAIVSPVNGITLAEPLTGAIQTAASDSDGSIQKVSFFSGSTLLGSVASPPFNLAVTNVAAGNYKLTAVATDDRGASATSPPVTISVVTPVPIQLSVPRRLPLTGFQFNHTGNPGLRYVVEKSLDLTQWLSIATNLAAGALTTVNDNGAAASPNFYRVRRLPNP
ncbi:MAG: hypothetical protein HY735_02765 [Verrucomicrobia bacterium]|nr:hypothetical protein [Verrucomicrobiota bacterium]